MIENIKKNKLPSQSSEIYEYNLENLDSLYRYMYLDCLYKEKKSEKNIKENFTKYDNLDNLTIIITHSNTFLDSCKNKLELILSYYHKIGVFNIILAIENLDSNLIKKYENKLNLMIIPVKSSDSKTKILNKSIHKVKTDYLMIIDDNSIITRKNFFNCLYSLKCYDFVYPSNRSVYKINFLNKFYENFDFKEFDCEKKGYLNYDSVIFCKVNSLKNIGSYNPSINSEKIFSDELNLRINLSNYAVKRFDDSIYLFDFLDKNIYDEDKNELIKQVNLSKFNDLNVLISQNKEMFDFRYENYEENIKKTEDEYKISVIIPIYNCEEFYLKRSINSLKNQSIGFDNIEVIIVDDASKYNESKKLVQKYSDKHENIKTFFLDVNRGSGNARNVGIKNATTDLICFLDYDDFYVNSFCETVYNHMIQSEDDLFIANYVNLSTKTSYLNDWNYISLNGKSKDLKVYYDDLNVLKIDPAIWSKCYRKSFLTNNNIKFSDYKVAQDNLFNIDTLLKAKGIHIENIPSVIYDTRDSEDEDFKSRTLIINKDSLITRINVYKDIINLYEKYVPLEVENKLNSSLNYWIKKHLFNSNLTKKEFEEVIDTSHDLFKKRLEKQTIKINNHFEIYEYFATKDYNRAYEKYLEEINSES